MGGSPYELSDWLDGWGMNPLDALINFISSYPQPALMGQAQHDWEPPRVATGVKNRASRLKALGNAVDPLQALPVLYGIKVLHEHLRKGGVLF
jgi:DNA (cytosine-5)-methyltransferase 1